MKRPSALRITLTIAGLAVCFYIGRCMFWLPAIPSHHADGVFEDISRRLNLFAMPGYCIKMPEFDLGKAHQAEYRLGGLTNLGVRCGVHLAIRDPEYRWWGTRDTGELDGKLRLDLLDSKGEVVVRVTDRLGDYTWTGLGGVMWLYKMNRFPKEGSFFRPEIDEEYRIRLAYEPDPRLAGYKGFAYVRTARGK